MKLTAEQLHLSSLRSFSNLEEVSVYKACVAVANNGITLPEEASLGQIERNLLESRRLIFLSQFDSAEALLLKTLSSDPLFTGDRLFLLGQVHHRRGKQQEASFYMNEAADQYKVMGDYHREIRARVNGALCLSSLESCLMGDLYALELEARRQGFLDITANICRTRAIELLTAGRLEECISQAMEASELYATHGYADDRSVAQCLAAIASLCLGDYINASLVSSQLHIRKGKVVTYLHAFESLLVGKMPKIPAGHSLERVSWKKILIKPDSLTGKILAHLRKGPCTRHELIERIWDEEVITESHDRRLYSAINTIRTDKIATIVFDGSRYQLLGLNK